MIALKNPLLSAEKQFAAQRKKVCLKRKKVRLPESIFFPPGRILNMLQV
jgi:hypothetical protein